MRQFFIYLVAAPLLVLAIALYIVFAEPTKKSYYWWGPERETYVMFSIVQQHHKGSIEIRARGKNFFKPGVPFKGEWMIWNNSQPCLNTSISGLPINLKIFCNCLSFTSPW